MQVKLGTAASVLRYNDSTSTETGTDITGLSTDWTTVKITITNDNDVFTRKMYVGDTEIHSDYTSVFPVFWGTTANNSGQSVYFDDLTIKTTATSGETDTEASYGNINIGNDKTTFTLKNAKGKTGIFAYVASYENGILKSIAVKEIAPVSDNEEISVTYAGNSYEKKLFVWQSMSPLKLSDDTE